VSADARIVARTLRHLVGNDRPDRERVAALNLVAAADPEVAPFLGASAAHPGPTVSLSEARTRLASDAGIAPADTAALVLRASRAAIAEAPEIPDGLRLVARLGPLYDDTTFPHAFDLFLPEARVAVFVAGDARAALVFGSARLLALPPPGGEYRFRGGPGTFYIRLDLLVPGGRTDRYIAVAVDTLDYRSGTPQVDPEGSGWRLTYPALAGVSAVAELAPTPRGAGACEGAVGAPPRTLRLDADTGAGAVAIAVDAGEAELPGGAHVTFSASHGVAELDGRVLFLADVAPPTLPLAAIASPYVALSGAAAVDTGGWSAPIVALGVTGGGPGLDGRAAWMLRLSGEVGAAWTPLADRRWTLGGATVLVTTGAWQLATTALTAVDDDPGLRFGLWRTAPSNQPVPFEVEVAAGDGFMVGCSEAFGGHVLAFAGSVAPVLGLPVAATGTPVPLPPSRVDVRLWGDAEFPAVLVVGDDAASAEGRIPLVIENAYLIATGAALRRVSATLGTHLRLHEGQLAVAVSLAGWTPTLPDPYVSNLSLGRGPRVGGGEARAAALITWADGGPALGFAGTLGPLQAPRAPLSDVASQRAPRQGGAVAEPTAAAAGRQRIDEAADDQRRRTLATQRERYHVPRDEQVAPPLLRVPGPSLLDVSTRIHQIGITLATGSARGRGERPATVVSRRDSPGRAGEDLFGDDAWEPADFRLSGMAAATALHRIEVFALPQIQWEPVHTLDKDQNPAVGWFPPALGSPHDGGPTRIVSPAGRLVPVVPDVALEEAVHAFSSDGEDLVVGTTLPFGIVSGFTLTPRDVGTRRGDSADFVSPSFATRPELTGALQLSLQSEGGLRREGAEDPSFVGFAYQTRNGVILETGQPAGLSVLGSTADPAGSVEAFFNTNFAGANRRAPITRLDLSGYGASTFSDWNDPIAAFGEAAKVQFSVLVGRTSYEFVKIISKLYPWGITVTRSVTVERRGGGGVVRRDSGWQASSPGLFDYPYRLAPGGPLQRPGYVVEPGLIEGLYDVRDIVPAPVAGDPVISLPGGGRVLPMYIDARVAVDGVAGRAPARRLLSFLHLEPTGEPISPDDLAELVERHPNTVGGAVDADIEIGGSGFGGRLVGIDVSVARDGATPVFVGSARVAPAFPPVGAWAVVRGPSDGSADMVGVGIGVPVIRSGVVGTPASDRLTYLTPRGRFRMADAADLRAGMPANDYGLMQFAPTHRFLFRRPEIEPGTRSLLSSQPPALVDVLATTLAKGFFPPLAHAIVFGGASFRLDVPTGPPGLRLVPDFAASAPRGALVLEENAAGRTRLDYAAASLGFTLSETRWSFDLQGVAMRADIGGTADMLGSRMRIVGASDQRPQMRETGVTFSPALEEILQVLPGFGGRPPFPPVDLSATNADLATKVALIKYMQIETPAALPVQGAVELKAKLELSAETKNVTPGAATTAAVGVLAGSPWATPAAAVVGSGVDKTALALKGSLKATIKIMPPPITPFFIIVGCEVVVGVKAALDFSGPKVKVKGEISIETTIFIGFGVGKKVGPFKAEAWLGVGYRTVLTGGSTTEALTGGVLLFEAGVDLSVAKIEVSAEYAFLRGTRDGKTVAVYSGELSISVSFGWIFKIELTTEVSGEDGV
jgi:hypothetical protein